MEEIKKDSAAQETAAEESTPDTTTEEEVKQEPADDASDDGDKKKKNSREIKRLENELEKSKKALDGKQKELDEAKDKYMRMLAEYDNFRRRSAKERESIYTDAYGDAVKEILPVLDNLERAAQYTDAEAVGKGVQMTLKGLGETLKKLGIEEVETTTFDPNLHNAVMHVEDDTKGEQEIVEVLQKGYRKGDKVIRYAMVKVAN